ncbi:MAG: nucleoside triphosphate pyrophosphohydrolase [Saprospiraceae bacterium]|nr:nucleoside triphosphate pyrophosphohydrolase [Saprospiraceae bacterium]
MNNDPRLIAFKQLLDIMDDLRAKCPWDMKQTFQSLRHLTIEETYELTDAILQNDLKSIEEEVGDVLLHLVFYAKLGSETGQFDIASILERLNAKLIHRHPHIYGDVTVADEEEVRRNWEKLKLKEGKKSVLEGVPRGLPAMIKAIRLQEKTKQVGFEWENTSRVMDKVNEELGEWKSAIESKDKEAIEDELGDVFFSLINYARFEKIDPEAALEKVNQKFKKRFEYIEVNAPKPLEEMKLEEMEALWQAAKINLRK